MERKVMKAMKVSNAKVGKGRSHDEGDETLT